MKPYYWVALITLMSGTASAKALQVSVSTMTVSTTTAVAPAPETPAAAPEGDTTPRKGPSYQQVEEPFGEWREMYGKVDVIRPDRSFRIRTPKGETEELENIPGVYIYRRGVVIPFMELNTGDWVNVRFKVKPI